MNSPSSATILLPVAGVGYMAECHNQTGEATTVEQTGRLVARETPDLQ